jgi:hypothetical protein
VKCWKNDDLKIVFTADSQETQRYYFLLTILSTYELISYYNIRENPCPIEKKLTFGGEP